MQKVNGLFHKGTLCLISALFYQLSAICFVAATAAAAAEPSASSGWSFAITPYLWLPAVDGSLRYNAGGGIPSNPDVDTHDKSLVDYLDGFFMLGGEVKNGRWLALTDFVYADFATMTSRTNAQMETSLIGTAWTLLGGYRALEGPGEIDVLGGLRYFGLKASTNWQSGPPLAPSGTVSDSTQVWDGLFALRGRVHLGKSRWFLPYYADIGTGQSKLTWQALGGAGYAFKNWLETSLTYRTIYYDERNDGLMNALSFTGPAAAFSFRF